MIEINNLDISIGSTTLLKSINLIIKSGEIVRITGVNGSGKTSLIETILGYKKNKKGEIKRDFKKEEYGYLPQVSHQFPKIYLTLGDISKVPRSFYDEALFNKNWHTASGGERKKALISRTLEMGKKLIVLDEPFNHLDQSAKELVAKELIRLSNAGVTILYTGHDFNIPHSTTYEVEKWK